MDYHTKKLLGLTDKNLIFPSNWLSERKINEVNTYIITARLDYIPKCCGNCGVKNEGQIIRNGTHKTSIQLLPIRSFKTVLHLRRTRFLCKECGKSFNAQTDLVDRNCSISKELKRKIALELTNNSSRKDIANRYFVSDVTIMRIMQECTKAFKLNFNYLPTVLCFDEFKAMKSCEGKMAFIYMDGQTHQVLGVLESRRLTYLRPYFLRYSRKARLNVKHIVMDMNAPYFELIKLVFPNAEIITDRFHVVQHINRSFNQLRVKIMNSYRKSDSIKYRRLKRFWKLLLKDSNKLSSSNYQYNFTFKRPMTEKSIIDELLSYDPILKLAYDTSQLLTYHFVQKDAETFFKLIQTLNHSLPEWFRRKLTFFKKYKQGICNALCYSFSNGPLEGINNKIKVMKRVAYGYRNFYNLRTRIYIIQRLISQ